MTTDRPTADDFGATVPHGYNVSDTLRVFGGFWAADPRPGRGLERRRAITHDVVVDGDAEVTVEVNGARLSDL